MQCTPMLRYILCDENLTRGLGDAEARMLVEWLVGWAELLADASPTEDAAWGRVRGLCRRGRAIGRFVQLWAAPRSRGAAMQLAASERFCWPPPAGRIDPVELMQNILDWESQRVVC